MPWFLISVGLSILMHVLEPVLKPENEFTESLFHTIRVVILCLPMLTSVHAIAQNAKNDYSNFAMAACMWAAMFKFCEYPLNGCYFIFRKTVCFLFSSCEVNPNPIPDSYFCFLCWSICVLFLVNWKTPLPYGKNPPTWVSWIFFVLCFLIVICLATYSKYKISSWHYQLIFLLLCALAQSKLRLAASVLHSKRVYWSYWIEYFTVVSGVLYIGFALVNDNPKYKGDLQYIFKPLTSFSEIGIPIYYPFSDSNIKLPVFSILHDLFLWASTSGVTVLSIVYN